MRPLRFRITILICLFVIVAVFIPSYASNQLPPFKVCLLGFTKPFLRIAQSLSSNIGYLTGLFAKAEENKLLRGEVGRLEGEVVRLRELAIENKRLRELRSFKKETPFRLIPARLIGKDASNWSRSIIIDKGQADQIKVNMSVIGSCGFVGIVNEVGSNLSRVRLILDPSSSTPAIVQRNRETGLLKGCLEDSCRMEYIDISATVMKGDVVLTSGLSHLCPRGLLIGKVREVRIEQRGLYKIAIIEPSVDFSRLEEVFCIER